MPSSNSGEEKLFEYEPLRGTLGESCLVTGMTSTQAGKTKTKTVNGHPIKSLVSLLK